MSEAGCQRVLPAGGRPFATLPRQLPSASSTEGAQAWAAAGTLRTSHLGWRLGVPLRRTVPPSTSLVAARLPEVLHAACFPCPAAVTFDEVYAALGPNTSLPAEYQMPDSECPVMFCKASPRPPPGAPPHSHIRTLYFVSLWLTLPRHVQPRRARLHAVTSLLGPAAVAAPLLQPGKQYLAAPARDAQASHLPAIPARHATQTRPLLKASCLGFDNGTFLEDLPYRVGGARQAPRDPAYRVCMPGCARALVLPRALTGPSTCPPSLASHPLSAAVPAANPANQPPPAPSPTRHPPVQILTDDRTDADAIVLWDDESRTAHFLWKYTEETRDWFTDANGIQARPRRACPPCSPSSLIPCFPAPMLPPCCSHVAPMLLPCCSHASMLLPCSHVFAPSRGAAPACVAACGPAPPALPPTLGAVPPAAAALGPTLPQSGGL